MSYAVDTYRNSNNKHVVFIVNKSKEKTKINNE